MTASHRRLTPDLDHLPDATRRTVADFMAVSASPTRDPGKIARALQDTLALSVLHALRERSRNAKGAGAGASPLN